MCENIDEFAERIADVETSYAPRFINGSVFNRETRVFHAMEGSVHVVHFDRQVRHRRAGPAFRSHADLDAHGRLRTEGLDPALIHQQIQNVLIEQPGVRNILRADVGDYSLDLHLHLLAFELTAPSMDTVRASLRDRWSCCR